MKLKDYVIEVLSPHEWLAGLEIHDLAIAAAVARDDWGTISFLISFFSKEKAAGWMWFWCWHASIYVVLDQLVSENAIERRQRVPSPYRRHEYRLTSSGLRRRTNKTSTANGELNLAL